MKAVAPTLEPNTNWYISAMEHLVEVVQELSKARDLDGIAQIVRRAARELTGADGASFVLRDGDQCYYVEENAIEPLWKGRHFPVSTCVSGWAMLHAKPVMIEDIYADPRVPQDAYRPTFVKSLAMVPIRRSAPIGAIGNYWAAHHTPSAEEMRILQALADTTSVALENAQLYGDLQKSIALLHAREERIGQQHEALEIFTRALAHDLKEPVRTINAFSELLGQSQAFSGRATEYFRHIKNAGNRMFDLIETVFHYIQLDDPQKLAHEPCNLNKIVQEVKENIAQLIQEKNARIVSDEMPTLPANRTQMIQLFQNLLCNAIGHNTPGLTVQISAQEKDGVWQCCVRDDGIGIDAKQREQIFQPFRRAMRTEKGSGLGLAICRKIMELHQGKIWCESTQGKGAKFFFTLPAPPVTLAIPLKEEEQTALHNPALASVLLIDDRESDLELTRIILTEKLRINCNLFLAQSGQEALAMLHQKHKENTPIDLALLDINMPEMDGFEVLQSIQNDDALKSTVVVMCTGSTYERDRKKSYDLGAAGYVVKPVKLDTLQDTVKKLPEFQFHKTDAGYAIRRSAVG